MKKKMIVGVLIALFVGALVFAQARYSYEYDVSVPLKITYMDYNYNTKTHSYTYTTTVTGMGETLDNCRISAENQAKGESWSDIWNELRSLPDYNNDMKAAVKYSTGTVSSRRR